jgi:hypothetical protein
LRHAGDSGAQRYFACGNAHQPVLAAFVGERLERSALDHDAHLLEVIASGAVRDSALDGAGVGRLCHCPTGQPENGDGEEQVERELKRMRSAFHGVGWSV